MDEERKSKFSAQGLMDRWPGVKVFSTHTAEDSDPETASVSVFDLYLLRKSCSNFRILSRKTL